MVVVLQARYGDVGGQFDLSIQTVSRQEIGMMYLFVVQTDARPQWRDWMPLD